MSAKYDSIGINYAELRKPDRRIARIIESVLGSAQTVLNVGAGTGSYEPTDRSVIAVEPSREMIRKRSPKAAEAIQASADDLPFDDGSFDASMAILTIHHWPDKEAGLREMRRVTRGRIVLLTFDPSHRPWLTDYLPELTALDEAQMPTMSDYERWLGSVQITPVLVPHDCSDGFLYAYWRRPAAYLDAYIRSGSSTFWAISNAEAGLQRLRRDLESGEWERRYAELLTLDAYDAGYRLVVAGWSANGIKNRSVAPGLQSSPAPRPRLNPASSRLAGSPEVDDELHHRLPSKEAPCNSPAALMQHRRSAASDRHCRSLAIGIQAFGQLYPDERLSEPIEMMSSPAWSCPKTPPM